MEQFTPMTEWMKKEKKNKKKQPPQPSKQRKEDNKSHLVRKKIMRLRLWVMEQLRYGTRSPSLDNEQKKKRKEEKVKMRIIGRQTTLRGIRKRGKYWIILCRIVNRHARTIWIILGWRMASSCTCSLRRGLLWRGSGEREEKSGESVVCCLVLLCVWLRAESNHLAMAIPLIHSIQAIMRRPACGGSRRRVARVT